MNTVLLTSYFSKKLHPQRGDPNIVGVTKDGRVKVQDFSYIEDWYNSVNKLNLKAVIFHDDLNDEFIKKYSTDRISFVKTDTSKTVLSNNDWRFFCYQDYLKDNKHDAVFMTDCSDVVVVKDPSELCEIEEYAFFAGKDIDIKWSDYKYANYSYEQIHQACGWNGIDFFKEKGKDLDLINMGVLGGTQENVEIFLDFFTKIRSSSKTELNINMAIGQFIFRFIFQGNNICVGEPLTSEYKKHQKNRKDVFFIHK